MTQSFLFPSTVVIEPTNKCNLGCEFCEANCTVNKHLKSKEMTPDNLEKILEKIRAEIINIVFQGDCEPTLNRHLPELVQIAARHTKSVALVTNGTRLNEGYTRKLLAAGVSWFAISIDDARPEIFNKLRLRADLKMILSGLRGLIRVRDEELPHVHIVVHKIIFPSDTLEDLKKFVKIFYLDYGVNQITFSPLVSFGDIKVLNWLKLRNQLESELIDDGIFINLREFCAYPYRTLHKYCGTNLLFISHNYHLSPCGLHVRHGRNFGNLLENDLEALVQGKSFQEFHGYWQKKQYSHEIPSQCRDCFLLKGHYHRYTLNEGHRQGEAFVAHPDLTSLAG